MSYVIGATDIIVDLQYGDCGKGKIAHALCTTKNYTHVLRYNGGGNAGHTIFHKGKKFVTHHIPAGVFAGIKSVIGPGCVLNPEKFFEEIKSLEDGGIATKGLVFVAKNTHVITKAHLEEDGKDVKVGTTRQGNGPAYRDKYARTGVRAESFPELQPYLVDLFDEWFNQGEVRVLAEGAQGFGLDIDWGEYPFVTSSHCTVGGVILNGVPYSSVREVWGVAKMYETYVGKKEFQPKDNPVFDKIGDVGEEVGATTGRRRQVNWMNMQLLERAIRINGITDVVFNKVDVLRTVGAWAAIDNGAVVSFKTEAEMKAFVTARMVKLGIAEEKVRFSENKDGF
jgi:adenylosuccinate synthase